MIITKSISRFARNTLDCLKYIRELKDINIPVIFEKESIAHTTQKSCQCGLRSYILALLSMPLF